MFVFSFILLGSLASLAAAHPVHSDAEQEWLERGKRSPTAARTMILIRGQPASGGYHYERPDRAFNPHAAMAAYATGGTVAAGTFYGAPAMKSECRDCNKATDEEEEEVARETPEEEEAPADEEARAPAVPERKPKAPKSPKPKDPKHRPTVDEDEDEDDEDDEVTAPRKGGRPGGSVYRNFFPMTFAGASMSRSRNAEDGEEEGGRGPVTAIANSFSKGRGAIAHSSAVAHGNPDAGQSRRSQPTRYRAGN